MGKWALVWLWVLAGAMASVSVAQEKPVAQEGGQELVVQEDGGTQDGRLTEEELETEKAKLRAMLWASIVIMSLFFLGVVLITVLRGSRRMRRLRQDRDRPTEMEDLWSQYRLEEEQWREDET